MNGLEDLEIFNKKSWIRHPLKPLLFPLAYVLSDGLKSCREQYAEVSRNLEVVLESLGEMAFSHPNKLIKSISLAEPIKDWMTNYPRLQEEGRKKEQYLIYTSEDHKIPFKPEYDTIYLYALSQIIVLINQASKNMDLGQLRKIAKTACRLNQEGMQVFRKLPARMHRGFDHERISLRAVQKLDGPLNCCPSLHIGYAVLLNNLAEKVMQTPKHNLKLWKDTEKVTKKTIDSVLYVKQHAIVDISCGILAAEIAFRSNYPNYTFNNFSGTLAELKNEKNDVPYDLILELYIRVKKHFLKTGSLELAVEKLFLEEKYPLISGLDADREYNRLIFDWNTVKP